jgi:DNA-binding SARP family transcriptional activator/tetratricopeptide (TPR) repeat protein
MGSTRVDLRILGPVELCRGDRLLDFEWPQRRHVVAALAVDAGRPVAVETLIDRIWEHAPAGARRTLQTHITRIRRLLEQASAPGQQVSVTRRSGGYVLDIDPECVDLHRFRRLVESARDASLTEGERAALLRDALRLWRGEPLAGLPGEWAARTRQGWIQQRLDAATAWAGAELRSGNGERVIVPLTELGSAHPLAEPLIAALMRALHAAGRQAEALEHYERLRRTLAEELGADPSATAQEAYQLVLRGEGVVLGGPSTPVPAQLPGDVPNFVGRSAELAALDHVLAGKAGAPAVVISAVSGTAGVGKTALAIHWAHRTRGRFPHGQLYVNLRGYDPEQPMTAADALAGFLTALGVPDSGIPAAVEGRAARYRTEIADRRMLIVLDNASTVEQVRPLLPGTGSCAVLVTSRHSLAGLVAVHGAHRLDLDLLPAADAHALLRRIVGPRVDAEPEAAVTLAEQCARLPLALRVAAELAAARPTAPLAVLVTELADQQRRLDRLDADGDPRAAVPSVFSWSVRHLPPDVARAFGLLGLHPGPDLDAYAAAALAGTGLEQARRILDQLARAHLAEPLHDGRYGMHDLLRAYAARLAAAHDPRAALGRLFDHCLATAATAMDLVYPGDAQRRPRVDPASTPAPALADLDAARAWLEAERACLVAVAAHAGAHGWAAHANRFSLVLFRHLRDYTDALIVHGAARDAARQAGDPEAEAQALIGIGAAEVYTARYDRAAEHFVQALALFRQCGDRIGRARTLANLSQCEAQLGRCEPARDYLEEARLLFRETGDPVGEAHVLRDLAAIEGRLGRTRAATDHFREALVLFRQAGDPFGEMHVLHNLGTLEARLGLDGPAEEHQRQALGMFRERGFEVGEGWALDSLGTIHTRRGQPERAEECHRQALAVFQRSGYRDSEAEAHNGLGEAAHAAGRHSGALTCFRTALAIAEDIGNRDEQARAHTGLGRAHEALGDPARARDHFDRALRLYADLGMPDAGDVRALLEKLP